MKKNVYILLTMCIAACALFSACEVDNYAAPDGTLTGKVIDEITNQGYVSEQPNGFQIRHEELSWGSDPSPEHFWGRPDGTFTNTKIFAGKYRITPLNGAFIKPASQETDIKSGGVTDLTFKVRPLVSFSNLSITKDGNGIKATVRLTKNVAEAVPAKYRLFVTSLTPYVGNNAFEVGVSSADLDLTDANFGTDLTISVSGNFIAGRKYYARIGARCTHADNTSNRYNLTQIFELQF